MSTTRTTHHTTPTTRGGHMLIDSTAYAPVGDGLCADPGDYLIVVVVKTLDPDPELCDHRCYTVRVDGEDVAEYGDRRMADMVARDLAAIPRPNVPLADLSELADDISTMHTTRQRLRALQE